MFSLHQKVLPDPTAGDVARKRPKVSTHGRASLLLSAVPLAFLGTSAVLADSLWLRSGEHLLGKTLAEDSAKITFESESLGRIEVPRERIQRLERDPVAIPPEPAATNQTVTLSAPATTPSDRYVPWVGPSGPDHYDWIELKSGEWLKGRMKSLQNDRLDFDSEKMDRREFDWKDISTVRMPRPSAALFGESGEKAGTLWVTTNQVFVVGETTNVFPRSDLIGISPSGTKEINVWSADLSAGLSFRAGNTRQADFNAQLNIDRRTPASHLSLGYLSNYGRSDGLDNVNNHRATAEYDRFLSRRLFVQIPSVEYYRDRMQNLDHRVTAGAGFGYDLLKRHRTEWNITAGPAYQRNWYDSVALGQPDQPGAAALVLSSRFDIDLTSRLEFLTELRAQVSRKEVGETTYHSLSRLKFKISKTLDLDISFTWDRIADPKTDAHGITPLKDDFRLITGLGLEL